MLLYTKIYFYNEDIPSFFIRKSFILCSEIENDREITKLEKTNWRYRKRFPNLAISTFIFEMKID